jgi:hypothetical protein
LNWGKGDGGSITMALQVFDDGNGKIGTKLDGREDVYRMGLGFFFLSSHKFV